MSGGVVNLAFELASVICIFEHLMIKYSGKVAIILTVVPFLYGPLFPMVKWVNRKVCC